MTEAAGPSTALAFARSGRDDNIINETDFRERT
jgi:hypothetical protein